MREGEEGGLNAFEIGRQQIAQHPVATGQMGVHGSERLTAPAVRTQMGDFEARMRIQQANELATGVAGGAHDGGADAHDLHDHTF